MSGLIERLKARGRIGPRSIDRFIRSNAFPLVEPSGVTFVYRGPADAVRLRHWIFGLPAAQPLERTAGTDLWHLFLELPPGSRVEYKFEVVANGEERWINDPLNPTVAHDPFGANSVCPAYGYRRPGWTLPDAEARPGSLDELRLKSVVFGDERSLRLYLPARFRRSRRYPLLIVHDGADFLRYADLKAVLDNLIHRLEIAPLIAVLSDPADRMGEYRGGATHGAFLAEELLPRLQQELPLLEAPAARGLMGASLGAVASLGTAWRYPGVFGNLLLQSGSFAFSDIGPHRRDPVFDPVVAFMNAYRANPGRPAERLYVSCGIYESLIYENRSMVPLFQDQGLQVRYEEARDGHHWENWRDRLQSGLSWLFPGPLWMVYE
jgi:enterochelin esterase family protein